MASQIGHGTGLPQLRRGSKTEKEGCDHAWQVMFAYEGPQMALRTVKLGPIPGEYPSLAVRQVVLDKRNASDGSLRQVMALNNPPSGETCLLCRMPFGATYEDPGLGTQVITRNRRNRFYCNICDMFIRACPGQAILELPVLVIDVKDSRGIRNQKDVGLARYPALLANFQRRVSAIMQKHMGFVLNTVGDAVIGVWPSGFVPEELRQQYGWDNDNPAKISAMFAIKAAEDLARDAVKEFDGERLPYRGALDTSEMAVFAVCSNSVVPGLEFDNLTTAETGMPLIDDNGNLLLGQAGVPGVGSESEFQTGPAATDIAGTAVEIASELASDPELSSGEIHVTRRTDETARFQDLSSYTYRPTIGGLEDRIIAMN